MTSCNCSDELHCRFVAVVGQSWIRQGMLGHSGWLAGCLVGWLVGWLLDLVLVLVLVLVVVVVVVLFVLFV